MQSDMIYCNCFLPFFQDFSPPSPPLVIMSVCQRLQGHMQKTVANSRDVFGTNTGTDKYCRQTHTAERSVSLRKCCRHHGLRFGGFSLKGVQYEAEWNSMNSLSHFILLHVHNYTMFKWQADSLADRVPTTTDLMLLVHLNPLSGCHIIQNMIIFFSNVFG